MTAPNVPWSQPLPVTVTKPFDTLGRLGLGEPATAAELTAEVPNRPTRRPLA